jgi:hypothetical protein
VLACFQKQDAAHNPAQHARGNKKQQPGPLSAQVFHLGNSRPQVAGTERYGIGHVGSHWRDADSGEHGKGDERAAADQRVNRAGCYCRKTYEKKPRFAHHFLIFIVNCRELIRLGAILTQFLKLLTRVLARLSVSLNQFLIKFEFIGKNGFDIHPLGSMEYLDTNYFVI